MPKHETDLFDRLTAAGLRKKTARKVSDAVHAGGRPQPRIARLVGDLRVLTTEVEDRLAGGPAKRRAAARKGAKTRERRHKARATAARKGARTRKSRTAR